MTITYKGNGRWCAVTRHENGTSELSGSDREGVLMGAIELAFNAVADVDEPEDMAPYEDANGVAW